MKLSKAEKNQILVRYIEVMVMCGHDISNAVGKPLSFFDFDGLIQNTIAVCNTYEMELTEKEQIYKNK